MTTAPVTSVTDELLAELEAEAAFDDDTCVPVAAGVLRALLAERRALQKAATSSALDFMSALSRLTDIRFACGDDGKRMLPELVEYIGALKRDSERLDFMDAPHPGRSVGSYDGWTVITTGTTKGRTFTTAREAIDNAMEATK